MYEYTPRFVVVPKNIGKVKVYYKVNYIERKTQAVSAEHSVASGSNKETALVRIYNLKNPGWNIDRTSIIC